jgi:hypothetical protein
MALALALGLLCLPGASSQYATLSFDPGAPPLATVRPSYLSVNLDTGSLYNSFPFNHSAFNALVAHLARAAPTQFRIGGGASDSTLFTGAGGASGNCSAAAPLPYGASVCVSAELMDGILAFAAATGVDLVWNLNGAQRAPADSPWDARNAEALLDHLAGAPARGLPVPAAFQLANEPEDWYKRSPPLNVSGGTLAADFYALRAVLAARAPLARAAIYGPCACCEDRYPLLAALAGPVAGALDALDVHAYPLPRLANNSCAPGAYTNRSAMLGVAGAIAEYRRLGAPLLAQGVPLVLGETATSAHGGCDGLSNRFVAGFTFMLELGTLGELGVAQVNRQDIAGFSSTTVPSNYALLGPPGWRGGGVPLGQPHPDYWVALLWKTLVGRRVLASALQVGGGGGGGGEQQVDAHVWCAAGGGGGVVITYFALDVPPGAVLALPAGVAPAPRTEFVLTAPGGALAADGALLNGAPLVALESGEIPGWPAPGRRVAAGAVALEPWSFGFMRLEAASAPACVGVLR